MGCDYDDQLSKLNTKFRSLERELPQSLLSPQCPS